MMDGIINFLISNDPIAAILRSRFVFKLFPMVNPDGVIHGNYRTNLAGVDLNRVWDSVDSVFSP
jgi:murein tripeptide amidase MpaA